MLEGSETPGGAVILVGLRWGLRKRGGLDLAWALSSRQPARQNFGWKHTPQSQFYMSVYKPPSHTRSF